MDTTLITEAVGNVAVSIDRSIPMSERMLTGLQTMLLGLGTVFSALIIIMCVLLLFKLFFYVIPQRREKAHSTAEKSGDDAVAADAADSQEDGALVAAITAAVAVYMSAEDPESGNAENGPAFRVVNFKRRY